MSIYCQYHPNSILIEDFHNSDLVCPECGIVVDQYYTTFSTYKLHQTYDSDYPFSYEYKKYGEEKNFIQETGERMDLANSTQIRAFTLYEKTIQSKILQKKTMEAKISACMYIACRVDGVPRSFNEFCGATFVNKKDFIDCVKEIEKTFKPNVKYISPNDFINRFCCLLGINFQKQKEILHIIQKIEKNNILPNRSPTTIGAAVIFMVSKDLINIKEIEKVSGVNSATIKNNYKCLIKKYPF